MTKINVINCYAGMPELNEKDQLKAKRLKGELESGNPYAIADAQKEIIHDLEKQLTATRQMLKDAADSLQEMTDSDYNNSQAMAIYEFLDLGFYSHIENKDNFRGVIMSRFVNH